MNIIQSNHVSDVAELRMWRMGRNESVRFYGFGGVVNQFVVIVEQVSTPCLAMGFVMVTSRNIARKIYFETIGIITVFAKSESDALAEECLIVRFGRVNGNR